MISQVLVNEALQRVEYEYLPTICFSCGHYGHIKEICPKRMNEPKESEESVTHGEGEQTRNTTSNTDDLPKNSDGYGPWILVERRGRRPPRTTKRSGSQDSRPTNNSRFHALETLAEDEGIQEQGSGLGIETGQRKIGPDV